jgi:hypothetical protein
MVAWNQRGCGDNLNCMPANYGRRGEHVGDLSGVCVFAGPSPFIGRMRAREGMPVAKEMLDGSLVARTYI